MCQCGWDSWSTLTQEELTKVGRHPTQQHLENTQGQQLKQVSWKQEMFVLGEGQTGHRQ